MPWDPQRQRERRSQVEEEARACPHRLRLADRILVVSELTLAESTAKEAPPPRKLSVNETGLSDRLTDLESDRGSRESRGPRADRIQMGQRPPAIQPMTNTVTSTAAIRTFLLRVSEMNGGYPAPWPALGPRLTARTARGPGGHGGRWSCISGGKGKRGTRGVCGECDQDKLENNGGERGR
jgi:hypothetical protein